ncbi:MerR family transcriptional regulator [Enterococcus gallinarum]|uniref:MerR family transcriptional regulator n=1 Tax=Enterococcus gallinarum TaxID=1353 RepID=UPI002DBA8F76|nr:MerR family transcriptional regulator [Enterococcus gallinarum]MEB5880954.1 MerR family transcriptional regulator [Enterococcus gallinarum]
MKLLTTSELASLFSISKHTIRHYIDIDLLTPKERRDNGYFFFDEENVYRLYQIIVLRNIGYSLKTIKTVLTEEDVAHYFLEAEQNLQKKIDELLAIKNTVQNIIQAQERYKLNEITFFERADRYFHPFPETVIDNSEIDLIKATKMNFSSLDQLFYVHNENEVIPCFQSKNKEDDLFFAKGTYASMSFIVNTEDCIKKNIDLFLADKLLAIKDTSPHHFLVFENIYCSLAYNNATIFTVEIKL